MAIIFKKIPGLKLAGYRLEDVHQKTEIAPDEMVLIAQKLSNEEKIPHSFRLLLDEVSDVVDSVLDYEHGEHIEDRILNKLRVGGHHFGRCSVSPLTVQSECKYEVVITMVVSGQSNVLLLNV